MIIHFRKSHPDAQTPSRAHETDAGFDLTAVSCEWSEDYTYLEYRTGIHVEIPQGYVGYIFPRSSVSRVQQILSNCVGVVDAGYVGEIRFRFRDFYNTDYIRSRYKVGDKIGQLIIMPIPVIEFVEVEELSESSRGQNGFGSSGQ